MGTVKLMILAATTAGVLSTPWLGEAIDSGADVAVADPAMVAALDELGAALGLDTEAGAWVIVFDESSAPGDVPASALEYGNARRAR